jgi:hypothetical protein
MNDDQEDPTPGNQPLSLLVGDLRGRMRAHEQRMDRHETWVGDKFGSLESKIDSMVGKLDTIAASLAEAHGAGDAVKIIGTRMFAVVVACISAGVGLCMHLFFKVLN